LDRVGVIVFVIVVVTSKSLKRYSKDTSLFTSAASNQWGCSESSPWEVQWQTVNSKT